MKKHFKPSKGTYLFLAYGIITGTFLHFANTEGQASFLAVQSELSSPSVVGLLMLSATPLLLIHNIILGPFTHEKQNIYLENLCIFPIETGIEIIKTLIGFILGISLAYA